MEEDFIKIIKDSYGIEGDLKKIKDMDSYPHMKKLSFNEDYVLKKVNKIYCKDINKLYEYLSKSGYVLLPNKTIDGKYGININNELYILYPKVKKINGDIRSFYWAHALNSIHNINVDENDFDTNYSINEESLSLLHESSELLSNKMNKRIHKLLEKYYNDTKVDSLVLSHGDPYDSNVMNDRTRISLIDTDGARLLPREFDIARLFYNRVNKEEDIDEIDKYINLFFCNYHNEVDMKLLKEIYVMDLIRSFSWLNLINNQPEREDYKRQMKELNKFKESILSERHAKVLKKL